MRIAVAAAISRLSDLAHYSAKDHGFATAQLRVPHGMVKLQKRVAQHWVCDGVDASLCQTV